MHYCKELDLPELLVFLLSAESNDLEVLFFNERHLVTWLFLSVACLLQGKVGLELNQNTHFKSVLECSAVQKGGETENYGYS